MVFLKPKRRFLLEVKYQTTQSLVRSSLNEINGELSNILKILKIHFILIMLVRRECMVDDKKFLIIFLKMTKK